MEREISTERQILSHLRMGREEEEEKRCVNIRFIMIDDVVRHFFRAQPSVRPSCHRGRVQTSSASMRAPCCEERLGWVLVALRQAKISTNRRLYL